MKAKNLEVGLEVQVKDNAKGFFASSYGKVGTIVELDRGCTYDVRVEFEGGDAFDWGNHKGIRKVKELEIVNHESKLEIGTVVQIRKTNRSSSDGFSTRHDTLIGIIDVLDSDDSNLNVKLHLIKGGIAWGNTDELVVLENVDSDTPKGTRVVGILDGLDCLGKHQNFKGCVGVIEDTLQSNNLTGIRWDNLGGDRNRYMGSDASMVRVLGE